MSQAGTNLLRAQWSRTLVEKSPVGINEQKDGDAQQPVVILISAGNDFGATAYRSLIRIIRSEARVVVKHLEVHAPDITPAAYAFEQEIASLRDAVDMAGLQHFHAVGYSGGGSVCLAFATKYPERLKSLALIEPAWLGNQERDTTEAAYWAEIDRSMSLPPAEQMAAFLQVQVSAGVELPHVLFAHMLSSARGQFASVGTMNQAFKRYDLERERLRDFRAPVYLAFGSLSNPIEQRKARLLTELFPDIRVEIYAGLHHFNPPQEAEPERFARALRDLWSRSAL